MLSGCDAVAELRVIDKKIVATCQEAANRLILKKLADIQDVITDFSDEEN